MSLLSIVASSSAFLLPASPPPKGSSIDSDWSTKNKKQPGFLRLISAWYAMVCLHFIFLAPRELRLSHARGHRLESCRDHPQNAATPVPFAAFAGTNWTRHAHCLIAPTGRTRRDPDHRVTDLRRGVAESPSADNARGCDAPSCCGRKRRAEDSNLYGVAPSGFQDRRLTS